MSFTPLSAAFFGIVGVAVFIEVVRGLKRGFTRSVVGLMTVVLSALIAAPLALLLSDKPAAAIYDRIADVLPMIEKNSTVFPSLEPIVQAAVDAVLSLLMFVVLFLLVRLVLRIVVAALFRGRLGRVATDASQTGRVKSPRSLFTPDYESADAPWHRRHERLLSAAAGALSGFLAALCILSPFVGTVSLLGYAYDEAKAMRVNFSKIASDDVIAIVEPYLEDPAVRILSAFGGELIFDAVTTTELEEETLALRREVEALLALVRDFVAISKVLSKLDTATEEQLATISGLGAQIEESVTMRLIAADFLNGAAENWLEGKRFFSISRPKCGDIIDPILDEALVVCRESDKDCVARDITTILNIYVIAAESGLLSNPDQETLLDALDENGVLDRIYAELKKNPCMAHLADRLTVTAMQLMMKAIDWSGIHSEDYREMLGGLSEAISDIGGTEGMTFEEQVGALTEYTVEMGEEYGIQIPESMAEMAASTMLGQLGSLEELTPEDLEKFLNQYVQQD